MNLTAAEMSFREEEHRHNAVIVVVIGNHAALTCSQVTAAFTESLNVSKNLLSVTQFHPEGFLVLFKEDGLRDRALSLRARSKIRGETIKTMPWTRLSHATLSMLQFKLRLCIEGVPPHAH